MTRTLKALVAATVLVLLGFVGIYGLHGGDVPGMQSAAQIAARVQDEANASLKAKGFDWARLRVDGRSAVIEGVAPTEDAKAMAVRLVKTSTGIGGVVNLVQVQSEGPYEWRAVRDGKAVILRGRIPSEVARIDLVETARALYPNGVVDQMEVQAEGAPNGDWLGAAKIGLRALVFLDRGEVALVGEALLLTGETASPDRVRMADVALSSVAAPFVARARVANILAEALAPPPPAAPEAAPQLRPLKD